MAVVNALIKQDRSPEQISIRLLMEQDISISHEWVYLHIYQDKRQGGDLHKHLRCQKKRRKRYGKQDRRGRIPIRISIDERPAIVANKSRSSLFYTNRKNIVTHFIVSCMQHLIIHSKCKYVIKKFT